MRFPIASTTCASARASTSRTPVSVKLQQEHRVVSKALLPLQTRLVARGLEQQYHRNDSLAAAPIVRTKSADVAVLASRRSYGTSRQDLDAKLRALRTKTLVEENDWLEQSRKLYEFEDKFLRDTLLEGNILMGWGEPRTAPVRFRNAGVRKRKRERQEAAAERSGKHAGALTPTLSAEEQLKVDRHRLASYSSVQSPAEPLRASLEERRRKLMEAKNKKNTIPTAK